MKIIRNARFWAAPVSVLAAVGLLAGCGGGGGISPNPTSTPTPSPVVSGVVAHLTASGGEASRTSIKVQWASPAFAPAGDVVEYHVFRSGVIVGVVPKQTHEFQDLVGEAFTVPSFTYFAINSADKTKLNLVMASSLTGVVASNAVMYRVTALYATPETAASATPEYAETEIGTSDTITP